MLRRTMCLSCSPYFSFKINDEEKINATEKECTLCKLTIPIINFRKMDKYYSPWCKTCSVKMVKKYNLEKKIKDVKVLGGQCSLCGYKRNVSVLCFHHLDPSKKDGLIGGLSKEKRAAELKKCGLFCQNCHREIHAGLHPKILKINYNNDKNSRAAEQRKRKEDFKQSHVDYLGGKCINCGYDKCNQAMTFHHRNPSEKLFGISDTNQKELIKVVDELNKCDLLCANCHFEIHHHNCFI